MARDFESLLKLYSRKEVQNAILELAKDREVAVRYPNGGFGKRPDVIQYTSDIMELVRNGASSFHVSEERWNNPLEIVTGMPKKSLDKIRKGWDCVLDIDSAYVEYSQITAYLLIEALKFYGINSAGIKFSGRKGFHIIVPFEAFPEYIGKTKIKDLFPEGPRMIADFLGNMIFDKLSEKILSEHTIEQIAKSTNKPIEDITLPDGKFNPFAIVDIDTILISSRHLFRSVYSFNEKSWLVSTPIEPSKIMDFKLRGAKPENIRFDVQFLKKPEPEEAKALCIQAFDKANTQNSILKKRSTIVVEGKDYFASEEKPQKSYEKMEIAPEMLKEQHQPPCINEILKGVKEDGRKRVLFILINYYKSLGFTKEIVQEKITEWNNKNYEPLREGYVVSQINWHARQKDNVLPPNCSNDSYYKGLRICHPDGLCNKIKNPLNYTLVKIKIEKSQKKKTVKKRTSKKTKRKTSSKK